MKLWGEVCSYLVIIGMEGWVSMDEEAHQMTTSTPMCFYCISHRLDSPRTQQSLRSCHYLNVPDNILCEHLLCRRKKKV